MVPMLSTNEAAILLNKDERHVRRLAQKGSLNAEKTVNERNLPQYQIPLTALDARAQKKYYEQHAPSIATSAEQPPSKQAEKALDFFSEEEREEIAFWLRTVEQWQEYRNNPKVKKKTDVDELFVATLKLEHPDMNISVDTLYRRWSACKANRLEALVDNRGKWKKGKSSVQPVMWNTFLYYFLDEVGHSVDKCYAFMQDAIRDTAPELYEDIPHCASFRRKIFNDLPIPLQILGRKGEKAYRDACSLYIRREYEDMESNDYWIADTHTLDIQSRDDKDGTLHRLYLSAFMDALSGVLVGWYISATPSSQTTLLALRNGIMRQNTIPCYVYTDNGREFLTHDVGGLGHRRKKPKEGVEQFEPPPIFERLGIKMVNALVKNPRTKTIERRFRDFKEHISRLFPSYTGGNIMERPECLKAHIKNGNVIVDSQLIEEVGQILEYYFNYAEYGGSLVAEHGKRKIDVYHAHSRTVRRASEEDLNLMLMRSSRVQTVGRRGVHLDINGQRFDYFTNEFRSSMFGKKVYFRYDPYNISTVRIYDLQDRYLQTVPVDNLTVGKYGLGTEDVKNALRLIHSAEREDKSRLKQVRSLGLPTARDLVLARVAQNRMNPAQTANPKVISIQRAQEEPLLKAVGQVADLDIMIENALKRQEEKL